MRFVYILIAVLVIVSCNKDDEKKQYEIDDEIIREYLSANGIDAVEHESGIYYVITKEGTGGHPNLNHTVVVQYKGFLLDGTVFDESTNSVQFLLADLITGWQIAINILKPGGEGQFFIPSELAYGNQQIGDIPPNSVLIFDIVLIEYF
jgi:FKBP-type peptidyl-prolyl cis-trans isomerase FkpA